MFVLGQRLKREIDGGTGPVPDAVWCLYSDKGGTVWEYAKGGRFQWEI